MGRLVYFMIQSLDGYVSDRDGRFDWAEPDLEVHAFANALSRDVGTYLYGRRMHETMQFWETAHALPDAPEVVREFAAVWQAADKVVHSSTLPEVTGERTRLVRAFDAEQVRALKASTDADVAVAGPTLAAQALRAGLVDELQLLVCPVVVGGGRPFLPDDVRLDLTLLEQRRFGGGAVYLRYAVKNG